MKPISLHATAMRQPTPIQNALHRSPEALAERRGLCGFSKHDDAWAALVEFDAALNVDGLLGPALNAALSHPMGAHAQAMAKEAGDFWQEHPPASTAGMKWDRHLEFYGDAHVWRAWEGVSSLGIESLGAQALICRELEKRAMEQAIRRRHGHGAPTIDESVAFLMGNIKPFPGNEMAVEIAFGTLGSWRYRQNAKDSSGGVVARLYGPDEYAGHIAHRLSALAQAWNYGDDSPLSEFAFGCIHAGSAFVQSFSTHIKLDPHAQALAAFAERQVLDKAAARAQQGRARQRTP